VNKSDGARHKDKLDHPYRSSKEIDKLDHPYRSSKEIDKLDHSYRSSKEIDKLDHPYRSSKEIDKLDHPYRSAKEIDKLGDSCRSSKEMMCLCLKMTLPEHSLLAPEEPRPSTCGDHAQEEEHPRNGHGNLPWRWPWSDNVGRRNAEPNL
jgi:hypothetical protein